MKVKSIWVKQTRFSWNVAEAVERERKFRADYRLRTHTDACRNGFFSRQDFRIEFTQSVLSWIDPR